MRTISMKDLEALRAGEVLKPEQEGPQEAFLRLSAPISHWHTARHSGLAVGDYLKVLGEWDGVVPYVGPTRLVRVTDEAFYAVGDSYSIGTRELDVLREEVTKSPRHRVRICCHKSAQAKLHEMFVCYTRKTSIAPHKHLSKDESFHVLEGELDFITFNQFGDVMEIVPMGTKDSGRPFYVRVPRDTYHTVAMTSDLCILHEGTAGPFDRAHTVQMGVTRST